MNHIAILALSIFLFMAPLALAKSGCCSHHDGVSGCEEQRHVDICSDGTLAGPTCKCWTHTKQVPASSLSDKDAMSDKDIKDQCNGIAKPDTESQKMCEFIIRAWVLNRARRHALSEELYRCQYDLISKTKPKAEQEKLIEEAFQKNASEQIVEPNQEYH